MVAIGRFAASRRLVNYALCTGLVALAALPAVASTVQYPTQSWNGYRWSRTGPLAIQLGANVSASWQPYFDLAATQWTAANNIDFVPLAGTTTAATCSAVFGTVQVCNANYGRTSWLGYATVYTSDGFIVEATVKLNDYYFTSGKYATAAWRRMTACQEIGHTLGLAHADVNRGNLNLGTCMDYTNDPTGTLGTNGTLANLTPSASDYAALDGIYATLDATQLAETTPAGGAVGLNVRITGSNVEALGATPEPATWAMLVVGFGGVGITLRRRRAIVA